ncbi:MAG TPA: flagellar protein FlaG [Rhodocyclaceae bacterium]|nr:flagellar protein FlaG [Rhodocyclaceae bacterium]
MNIQPATGLQGFTSASASAAPVRPAPPALLPEHGAVGDSRPDQQVQPAGREQTEEAVKRIKEFVQPINDSIQFSLDDDTGFTVVKVVDLQTKEVLRQIPSEEAINIAKALDKLKGLLIHSKA